MDLFYKLLRSDAAVKPRTTRSLSNADLLDKLSKSWKALNSLLHSATANKLPEITRNLNDIADVLIREETLRGGRYRGPGGNSTGTCFELFLKERMLPRICEQAALADNPSGYRREVLKLLIRLVDELSEHFLTHVNVHRPLDKLLQVCIYDFDEAASVRYEEVLLELLNSISSKIRESPDLLDIWFFDRSTVLGKAPFSVEKVEKEQKGANYKPVDPEFQFFSYLLRFIHRPGKTGDFARMSVRTIVGLAKHRQRIPLAAYIAEKSGLMDTLVAALGACYSQLPRRHIRLRRASSLANELNNRQAELDSAEIEQALVTLITLLEFSQLVLRDSGSTIIGPKVLSTIHRHFLETVLLTSLREAGQCCLEEEESFAAESYNGDVEVTLYYVERMIQSIGEISDEFGELFSEFLFGDPRRAGECFGGSASPTWSEHSEEMFGSKTRLSSMDRRTLLDDVQKCTPRAILMKIFLGSPNSFAVGATLRLLQTSIARLGRVAVRRLLPGLYSSGMELSAGSPPDPYLVPLGDVFEHMNIVRWEVSDYHGEVDRYFGIIRSIVPGAPEFVVASLVSEGFEKYIIDAENGLQYHMRLVEQARLRRHYLMREEEGRDGNASLVLSNASIDSRHVSVDDMIMAKTEDESEADSEIRDRRNKQIKDLAEEEFLQQVLGRLELLMQNPFQVNLALTGLLAQLLLLPNTLLFLFLFSGDKYVSEDEDDGRVHGLFPVLSRLAEEASRRMVRLPNGVGGLQRMRQRPEDSMERLGDRTDEFLRDVLVLNEFVKECVAIVQVQTAQTYLQLDYS